MTQQALLMHHEKLRLASRSDQFRFMRPFDELIESCGSDLREQSQHILRQELRTARLAVEECVSFDDDNEQSISGSSFLPREEIQKAGQDWQRARELEAAVIEQEAVLLSIQASAASEIDAEIQMIEQRDVLRAEIERSPLEDAQNAPPRELSTVRQGMQAQLQQKRREVQDELARIRMFMRVAEVKSGEKRRKSLVPPSFIRRPA